MTTVNRDGWPIDQSARYERAFAAIKRPHLGVNELIAACNVLKHSPSEAHRMAAKNVIEGLHVEATDEWLNHTPSRDDRSTPLFFAFVVVVMAALIGWWTL